MACDKQRKQAGKYVHSIRTQLNYVQASVSVSNRVAHCVKAIDPVRSSQFAVVALLE